MKNPDPFIDEVTVTVRAGDGGNGALHFRREKFRPRGGPDGGDGGRGGDVVLVADEGLATLRDHRHRRAYNGGAGEHGDAGDRHGANGADCIVRVPVGTQVFDADAGVGALADLNRHGERFTCARGGRGGRGNARFTTATRQAPDFATPGKPGKRARLTLSLKLLADAGLLGRPNAGKSTLLARISAARPRVAAYPFTTLTPHLGVARHGERRIVVADIPGLIEGASRGAGLGGRFLRHIERTRVLVHLLDGAALLDPARNLLREYESIRGELRAYGGGLETRPELVVLNKCDLLQAASARAAADALCKTFAQRGVRTLRVAGVTGEGIGALLATLAETLGADENETTRAHEHNQNFSRADEPEKNFAHERETAHAQKYEPAQQTSAAALPRGVKP